MIKGKSPEKIRSSTFNIVNDFIPGEEEQLRKEMSGLKIDKYNEPKESSHSF